ncbi:MAG TPA: hypothetical protein PLK37_03710 [Terricaulis sp.]|nr:hypothetical protein [Terricaulis sp.]
MLSRKELLLGLAAAPLAGHARAAQAEINPRWLISEEEATAWHRAKDQNGPALTGTESWRRFMAFLEAQLGALGCVDIHRSPWTFTRRFSSMWPDASNWSLVSNGRAISLANYAANCGLTGASGVTAQLVLWDDERPPDVAGKIVVYRPQPRADVRGPFADSDYERMTPFDSWPEEGRPAPQAQNATHSIAAPVWDEMTASSNFIAAMRERAPAGVLFAFNLNRAAAAGLYTFRVPTHYDFPAAYLDRVNGQALVADARAGAWATLRVEGREEQAEAYQLIAYLPGDAYGTPRDEQIHLRTHTDGPSISQDNGALGLLALIGYMACVRDRSRTLMLEFDCRHFMPGAETAWAHEDYFVKHPNVYERVRALIAMEHLGQIDYVEDGEDIRPSGRSLPTWIYASANDAMIEAAYEAARANNVRSAIIRSPGRVGANGASQGPWYGMSRYGALRGLPSFGMQGDLGAYWAHSAGIERFDARAFVRQIAAFCQLTGFLMRADLAALRPAPVDFPQPTAFSWRVSH